MLSLCSVVCDKNACEHGDRELNLGTVFILVVAFLST